MIAIKTPAAINGMYTWAIEAGGRIYPIDRDYKGRYMLNRFAAQPPLTGGEPSAFGTMTPDEEHTAIKRLLRQTRRTK